MTLAMIGLLRVVRLPESRQVRKRLGVCAPGGTPPRAGRGPGSADALAGCGRSTGGGADAG